MGEAPMNAHYPATDSPAGQPTSDHNMLTPGRTLTQDVVAFGSHVAMKRESGEGLALNPELPPQL